LRGSPEESYTDFSSRIFDTLRDCSGRTEACKATLTCDPPPKGGVVPYRKDKIALVTLCGENGLEAAADELAACSGFTGAFRVETALPVEYDRTWKDGEKTPGLGLLTLFRKREDIDYDDFIRRWHNGHTPLTLKIHPIRNYVRNVVKERIRGEEKWYDGIVEEHCLTREDLLKPSRFFGGILKAPLNMIRVYRDVKGFIDYSSIETYCVEEYWIKS
jgi:hypothetical protein